MVSICEYSAAAISRKQIAAVTRPVSSDTCQNIFDVNSRRATAITSAASAPAPPASVGVKMPPYMPPSTVPTRMTIGRIFLMISQFVASVSDP